MTVHVALKSLPLANPAFERQLRAELKGTRDSLSDDLAATQARLAATQARLDAPVARLAEELRGFAVFFQDIDTVLDETAVREKLARVVPLAGAAGGVRVTGHADETGTPARNRIVSRQRAEAVARLLAEAGMDRQKIVIVSQANATPLADKIDGNGLRNRRATLEPLFASELPAGGDAPQ